MFVAQYPLRQINDPAFHGRAVIVRELIAGIGPTCRYMLMALPLPSWMIFINQAAQSLAWQPRPVSIA